jgi:hypothetical protein
MAVEGNLEDISLTSLVQVICLEQRKGALVLKRRGEEGTLFFENGEVVHATVGSLAGEEAVYQLLRWTDGTFRVSNHVTIPRRTVTVPWGHLLLEGMRRIDEQKDREAAQAQALSRAEIAQDGALENDLIFLLSKLEHLRAQLANKKSRKRPTLALQILTEMVNDILAFSEECMDAKAGTDSLTRALAEAGDMYPAAQLAWIQPNQLSDRTVSKLYSDWPGNAASRRQAFHQTGESMVYILEAYFSLFTARFRSSSAADRWRETFSIFVADLTRVVDKIKF